MSKDEITVDEKVESRTIPQKTDTQSSFKDNNYKQIPEEQANQSLQLEDDHENVIKSKLKLIFYV